MSVLKSFQLDGRVAAVTGATGHLGGRLSRTLLELGAHVVLVDVHEERCTNAVRQLEAGGFTSVSYAAIDLRDRACGQHLIEQLQAANLGLDILVNNAAYNGPDHLDGYGVPFEKQRQPAWQAALDINLTALFELTQKAVPLLRQSENGSIVNISSIYGVVGSNMSLYEGTGMGSAAVYAATKGGIVQMTRYLATALAPHVRVNSISPGGISRNQPAAFVERYERLTPIGRMATERDFAGALALLASDAGSYITGHNLMVDGGFTAW